jgi:hypothetical protein
VTSFARHMSSFDSRPTDLLLEQLHFRASKPQFYYAFEAESKNVLVYQLVSLRSLFRSCNHDALFPISSDQG